MPHWRQEGATYFVTYRLADSLPQNKLQELEGIRREWQLKVSTGEEKDSPEALTRQVLQQSERWLDQGLGSCILRRADFARLVVDAMHFFDSTPSPHEVKSLPVPIASPRYELDAYVVMPNHVHAILRPLQPRRYSLEDTLGSWKQHSARLINAALHTSGEVWQEESYDRIIRDEEHLWRTIQYIGRNPTMAGLASKVPLWIRPEWENLRWRFASEA